VGVKDWTQGPSSGWTPEQAERAATYGVCMTCGAPRETKTVERLNKTGFARRDGEPEFITETAIVCPNGHPQS